MRSVWTLGAVQPIFPSTAAASPPVEQVSGRPEEPHIQLQSSCHILRARRAGRRRVCQRVYALLRQALPYVGRPRKRVSSQMVALAAELDDTYFRER